ncbi:MAG: Ig-like domain-containing protein, partial [Chloroflexota bacterium]
SNLSFRKANNDPLTSFFVKSGLFGGQLNIDDVYVDASGKNTSYPPDVDIFQGCEWNEPRYDYVSLWSKTFDGTDLANGSLDQQDGWEATSGAVIADDPSKSGNKLMEITGASTQAVLPRTGPIIDYLHRGGVFFRMKRQGTVNAFVGLSDVDRPASWSDYEIQFGTQNDKPNDFVIRDGSEFLSVTDQLHNDTWYCVWLLATPSRDEFNVLISGGQYGNLDSPLQLQAEGKQSFSYRNGGHNHLDSLYIRTGPGTTGSLLIDDIYVNHDDWDDTYYDGDEFQNFANFIRQDCPYVEDNDAEENIPPSAQADEVSLLQNTYRLGIDVLANDTDPNGDILFVDRDLITYPEHGYTRFSQNEIFYHPNTDFVGIDTFIYKVCDSGIPSLCSQAQVTINVNAADEACYRLTRTSLGNGNVPFVRGDKFSPGCANDHFVAGTMIDLRASPNRDWQVDEWQGTINDSSTFEINSVLMPAADHTVSITYTQVDEANNDPIANADSYTINKNDAENYLDVLANDTVYPDEGELLVISSVDETSTNGGTIVNHGNVIVYTPLLNFVGFDSFSYTISDGNGGTASAEVTIEVVSNELDVRYIDVVVSLYRIPNQADKAKYETIMEYFADGIYEMSNGVHKVRTVTFYQNGEAYDWADVRWNEREWPRAYLYGIEASDLYVTMGDIFDFPTPYNALLSEDTLKDTGYVLAHEYGHYYYGIFDEYGVFSGDEPVPNSVMNNQWRAGDGDLNYLNFSIPKNNVIDGRLRKTNQNRFHEASGWETLLRHPSQDPNWFDNYPTRPFYPELAAVAPVGNQDSPIEIDSSRGIEEAQSMLNVVWKVPETGAPSFGNMFSANVRVVSGEVTEYPEPIVITAQVAKEDPITGVQLTATATTPNGSVIPLVLTDDGAAPDDIAGDGFYTGHLPYSQNGYYNVSLTFSNGDNSATYTTVMAEPIRPEDSEETYVPRSDPVGEEFEVSTTALIRVEGVPSPLQIINESPKIYLPFVGTSD